MTIYVILKEFGIDEETDDWELVKAFKTEEQGIQYLHDHESEYGVMYYMRSIDLQ